MYTLQRLTWEGTSRLTEVCTPHLWAESNECTSCEWCDCARIKVQQWAAASHHIPQLQEYYSKCFETTITAWTQIWFKNPRTSWRHAFDKCTCDVIEDCILLFLVIRVICRIYVGQFGWRIIVWRVESYTADVRTMLLALSQPEELSVRTLNTSCDHRLTLLNLRNYNSLLWAFYSLKGGKQLIERASEIKDDDADVSDLNGVRTRNCAWRRSFERNELEARHARRKKQVGESSQTQRAFLASSNNHLQLQKLFSLFFSWARQLFFHLLTVSH